MRTSILVLFSGLPGCGKTTLARRTAQAFGFPLFAKDRIQSRLRALGLEDRATGHGYHLILDLAHEQLSLGVSAILDAVFPRREFRSVVKEIAAKHQAAFLAVYCYCSDRELWRQRMQARMQYVPDWTPVGWNEVERLEPTFEPWAAESGLFLDAANEMEQNYRLLAWEIHSILKWDSNNNP